jgi:hypothetical protein
LPDKKNVQTASGKAVYRLLYDLRVPTAGGNHFRWLPSGTEAGEDELAGLVLPALEEGGFVKKIAEASYACEACAAHGTADEKKAVHKNLLALREHYSKSHPGLAAPTE